MKLKILLSFFLLSFSFGVSAALLPAKFVAGEFVKTAGAGIYEIQQDVQFPTTGEPLLLRETWWVQSDNVLRLQVVGLRELKDQFHLDYVYQYGVRSGLGPQGKTTKKIGDDFVEKYFHFRSAERFLDTLVAMKIIPGSLLNKRVPRSVKEVDFKPESQVRLSRVGGAIAYTFGTPSPAHGEALPGFWIEQDTFALRKFRLPSSAEVTAEKFAQSPRGLLFPRLRTVRWGTNSVQIQTLNVAAKTGIKADFFQPARIETVSRMDGIENPTLKSFVEEFYLRFR